MRAAVPVVVPKCNPFGVSGINICGIGKIDRAKYAEEQRPIRTQEGWWRFAQCIARRDLNLMRKVFDLSTAALKNLNPAGLVELVDKKEDFWAEA